MKYLKVIVCALLAILFAIPGIAFATTTVLPVFGGGTGWGNISANTFLTGNGASALATTSIGSGLSLSGGVLSATGGGGGIAWPWSAFTNYGTTTIATTTPYQAFEGLFASSTSHFVYADFQQSTTSSLYDTGITSALGLFSAAHLEGAFAGSNCSSHQYASQLSAVGALTCSLITLTTDVSGTLPIANGGTNAGSFTQTNGILAYDGTREVNFANYTLTSSGLTAANASTTLISNAGAAWINGELTGFDALTNTTGQVTPLNGPAFQIGTSTTWTATSSTASPLGDTAHIVMKYSGTLRTVACATGAGTLELELSVNGTNDYIPASTTAGTYTFSNTFTKGQVMTVIGGNPASSPTYATCSLGATQTP